MPADRVAAQRARVVARRVKYASGTAPMIGRPVRCDAARCRSHRVADDVWQPTGVGAVLRVAWAAPCSLVGALLGLPILAAGGTARRRGPALEIVVHRGSTPTDSRLRRLPFAAITFGHVILAASGGELDALRAHEHVHVRQYEVLGLLFFPAYAAASLVALLRGRDPYTDNAFERHAFGACRDCARNGEVVT